MLTKIWKVVKAIGAFIETLVDVVGYLISSIIEFFQMIPKAVSYLTNSVAFLPASILALFSVIVTVLIIKKVVNR